MAEYIRQPNPAGYYYRPETLLDVDVYVEDDFEREVRYVCLSVANYDQQHSLAGDHADQHHQQLILVELRPDSSPERTHLLWREDPLSTGNHYIDPDILTGSQFTYQLMRFYAHLRAIPPFGK